MTKPYFLSPKLNILVGLNRSMCVATCPPTRAQKGLSDGPRVHLPLKENVWSLYQCLFEENVRKIKKTMVCVF